MSNASANATAQFGIVFTDETDGPVTSSTTNLEKLRETLRADVSELAEMQKALRNLKAAGSVNVQQFSALKQSIEDHKVKIAATQTKYLAMGGSFKKAAGESKSFGEQLRESLSGVGGPIGSTTSSLSTLATKLGKAGVAGAAVLVVAALVAIGAAALFAAARIARFAVSAADAYRDERLMLEGMTKVPLWLGLWGYASKASGAQIQSDIDGIVGSVSQSRAEIVGLAQELCTMGIRGKSALKAVADAEAVGGARGKAYAIGLITWNRMLGKSAEQTAAIIEKKFGALAASKAMGFGVQMAKLRENVRFLFSGVKIEGFLGGLQKVTALLSQTTVTGRALKQIIEVLLNPIFGGAGRAGDLVRDLFRDGVIGVQRTILWFQKLEIWYLRTFNRPWFNEAKAIAAKTVLFGVVGVLTMIAVLAGTVAVSVALIAGALLLLGAAIVAPFYGAYKGLVALKGWFASIDWAGLGTSIVQGMADGVTGAAGIVWSAIKGLGTGALKLLKNVLGIHSPSALVKAQVGVQVPGGMAAGIREGMPVVHRAVRQMAEIPTLPVYAPPVRNDNAQRAPVNASAHAGGNTYHFYIQATEPKAVADEVYRVLRQLEVEMGVAVG